MKRYQAYVWNGTKYTVFSVSKKTATQAKREVESSLINPNEDIQKSVLLHWKEKEIIVKEVEF